MNWESDKLLTADGIVRRFCQIFLKFDDSLNRRPSDGTADGLVSHFGLGNNLTEMVDEFFSR